MARRWGWYAALVFLAPVAGAVVARLLPISAAPEGFWRGLVVQVFLAAAPLAYGASGGRWEAAGLGRAGALPSLLRGTGYSAVYLALVLGAAAFGVRTPHFDEARRILGLPALLALYLPFWGVLEGVWIALFLHAVDRVWKPSGRPGWPALLLGGLGFGLAHAAVQAVLYGAPLLTALGYVAVGVVFVVAGTIVRATGSAWGLVLFWTVSNF